MFTCVAALAGGWGVATPGSHNIGLSIDLGTGLSVVHGTAHGMDPTAPALVVGVQSLSPGYQ
jgi:hypothetical protein